MLGYSFLNIFRMVDTVSHAGSTEKDVVFASKTCPVWAGETEKQKLESSSVSAVFEVPGWGRRDEEGSYQGRVIAGNWRHQDGLLEAGGWSKVLQDA